MIKSVLLFFFSVLFFACGGNGENNSSNIERKVFHYIQHRSVTSLDPAFAKSQANIWAIDHLYNGLVQLDDGLNIQPSIAKSWTISEDGLTYTFNLRDDVFFHDDVAFPNKKGRKVVAEDFVYSFERVLKGSINSPGGWIFKGRVAEKNPFQAIDNQTFMLRLMKPFRPMLGILTMQYCSVVPNEAVEKYGADFRKNPVGTGPFKFKRWLENQSLFLTKNKNYFEKENGQTLPYLDGVRVSFVGDRKTAYLELIAGKTDFMSGLESSFVNELLSSDGELLSKQSEKLTFLKSPFLNSEYLGIRFNGEANNPLVNKKIRQALNYGFDREKMLRTMRNKVGKPANSGFTPIGLPSFSYKKAKGYNFNPDKARQLLSEAGFSNGKGLPTIELLSTKDYEDLCTFIARQWEDIGVKVQIELEESATLREKMKNGQASFFRGSWIADYPDAESFLTVFYGKNPAPPNYTQFKNVAFDAIYEEALNENDDTKRYALYNQMDKILIEEAPVVFLFYDETAWFVKKGISGLSKNAINLLSLKKVKK
ncbi:MAG: ABC transporter substrate-binding protein [Saprospiraceae bacterium]|nr:ABC transporter substrate-binding protein [Saprospiraceae bacterium]